MVATDTRPAAEHILHRGSLVNSSFLARWSLRPRMRWVGTSRAQGCRRCWVQPGRPQVAHARGGAKGISADSIPLAPATLCIAPLVRPPTTAERTTAHRPSNNHAMVGTWDSGQASTPLHLSTRKTQESRESNRSCVDRFHEFDRPVGQYRFEIRIHPLQFVQT